MKKPGEKPIVEEVTISANLFNAINLYLTERPWREVNQLIGELEKARVKASLALQTQGPEPPPPGAKVTRRKEKGKQHAVSGNGSNPG